MFVRFLVQTVSELREQLQSKEKEHEVALHTLKDEVMHACTHTHTESEIVSPATDRQTSEHISMSQAQQERSKTHTYKDMTALLFRYLSTSKFCTHILEYSFLFFFFFKLKRIRLREKGTREETV